MLTLSSQIIATTSSQTSAKCTPVANWPGICHGSDVGDYPCTAKSTFVCKKDKSIHVGLTFAAEAAQYCDAACGSTNGISNYTGGWWNDTNDYGVCECYV